MAVHHHPPARNQTHQPHDDQKQDREQEELGVVQEGERIVPQEGDVGVVGQCGKVERVAQEGGQEIARAAGKEWQQQKLDHVEMEI